MEISRTGDGQLVGNGLDHSELLVKEKSRGARRQRLEDRGQNGGTENLCRERS